MKSVKIPLTRGLFATVDANLPASILTVKWFAQKSQCRDKASFYAARRLPTGELVLLHRVIKKAKKGEEIDHKDGDTLNCRRKNLRRATSQQNSWNQAKQIRDTHSQFKGVCWVSPKINKTNPWLAYIGGCSAARGRTRRQYLGYHPTEEAAALAYNTAARSLFGKFARLNVL